MIRIVIDTNKLPRNLSAPSAAFTRIVRLVEEGVIEVIMPHVIAEEWRTQQMEHLRKQLQKAGDALKDLLGGGHLYSHDQLVALTNGATAAQQTTNDIEGVSQQALARLLTQLQTTAIPVADTHGGRVIASYFKGSPPFSGLKTREDFPDAFVYETLADLNRDAENPIIFITADKNLATHASSLAGVRCMETLEQLVESEAVQQLTAQIELETQWRDALPGILAALQQSEGTLIADPSFINSFINSLAGREVEHHSIPSDNSDARIDMVDDPTDVEIDWDNAEDYGPGVVRVPFTCQSEVLLDFYIHHADAYGQPDHIRIQWADHEVHHFFEAQSDATAAVQGFISVTLEEWSAGLDEDTTDVSVDEITEADLVEDKFGNALK